MLRLSRAAGVSAGAPSVRARSSFRLEWVLPGTYVCPVCEREVDDAIIPFHKNVERQILELIRQKNPRWVEPDGSIPKCVDYYKALIASKRIRS